MKKMFLSFMITVLLMVIAQPCAHIAYAAEIVSIDQPTEQAPEYDYYDSSLPVEEIYSNPGTFTTVEAVEFGTSTEVPALALYVGDPNWGDHRQFARMAPVEEGLTAGDSVAKIALRPNQQYWVTEYLVNTAAADGEAITGLKLFLDFPERIRAGETNYLYAYLNSDNDVSGSRVCCIELQSDKEIWLRSVEQTMTGISMHDVDQGATFFADLELGLKNVDGEGRVTLTMEWPENFDIKGGIDEGYFAMTMIETFSENPAKRVIYAESDEEFDRLIADTEEPNEEIIPDDGKDEAEEEESKTPGTLGMLVLIALLISIIYSLIRLGVEVHEQAKIDRYFKDQDKK